MDSTPLIKRLEFVAATGGAKKKQPKKSRVAKTKKPSKDAKTKPRVAGIKKKRKAVNLPLFSAAQVAALVKMGVLGK